MTRLTHSAKSTGITGPPAGSPPIAWILSALLLFSALLGPCTAAMGMGVAMDTHIKMGTGAEPDSPHPCMTTDDCHLFSAPAPVDADKVLLFESQRLPQVTVRSYLVPYPTEPARDRLFSAPPPPTDPPYLVTRRLRL